MVWRYLSVFNASDGYFVHSREAATVFTDTFSINVEIIWDILSNFDLESMGDTVEAAHLFAEASKLAYADRGLYMADSDFVDMPEGLLDPDYLAARAALIDPAAAMESASSNSAWEFTIYFSAISKGLIDNDKIKTAKRHRLFMLFISR